MRLTSELNHDRSPQGIGRFHATLGGTGEHAVGHPVLADLQLGFPAREEKVGLIKGQVAVDHQPPGQGHGIVAMGTARLAPALDHPFELGRGEQPMALNGVEDGLNDNGHDSPREKWDTINIGPRPHKADSIRYNQGLLEESDGNLEGRAAFDSVW